MKDFIDGLFVKNPREGTPDFVKGSLSILVDKFTPYLKSKANSKGYVNIDLLVSQDGNLYAKLNDWKPLGEAKPEPAEHEIEEGEEIDLTKIPY
ncbi:MAG: hypothetical protein P4L27_05460 [Ignavibacteriaceae bacterium]|nr:hypothetical protein [Ignavibacteriaceae bacterium]